MNVEGHNAMNKVHKGNRYCLTSRARTYPQVELERRRNLVEIMHRLL